MTIYAPVSRATDTDDRPYRAEFLIKGEWYCAAIRFAMASDAIDHARGTFCDWTTPDEYRVVDTRSLTVVHP